MLGVAVRIVLRFYRRAQRLYWELRAPDLYRRYGQEQTDFPTLKGIITRYKPESVLDLGCGTGRLFPVYLEAGLKPILGVDIAAQALALAHRAYPQVPTRRARIEDLAVNRQFDLIVVNRVFQHLPPENLPGAVATTTRISRQLIYLNEIGVSDDADLSGLRYMFKHDYPRLFAVHGWHPVEQGLIPSTRQTYLLLAPQPAPA